MTSPSTPKDGTAESAAAAASNSGAGGDSTPLNQDPVAVLTSNHKGSLGSVLDAVKSPSEFRDLPSRNSNREFFTGDSPAEFRDLPGVFARRARASQSQSRSQAHNL